MEMVGNSHGVIKKKKPRYTPPMPSPSEDLAKAIKSGAKQPIIKQVMPPVKKSPIKPIPLPEIIGSVKSNAAKSNAGMTEAARRKLTKMLKGGAPMMRKES